MANGRYVQKVWIKFLLVPGSWGGEQWPSAMGFVAGLAGVLVSSSPADMSGVRHSPRSTSVLKCRLPLPSPEYWTNWATEMMMSAASLLTLYHPQDLHTCAQHPRRRHYSRHSSADFQIPSRTLPIHRGLYINIHQHMQVFYKMYRSVLRATRW